MADAKALSLPDACPLGAELRRHVVALRKAMLWVEDTDKSCLARQCTMSLESLIKVGSEKLFAVSACRRAMDASGQDSVKSSFPPHVREGVSALRRWIGHWRAAAAEAKTLGLEPSTISYKYWQHNIDLPEEVTRAQKWFNTAEPLAESNAMDQTRLVKLISAGNSLVAIVVECQSSWPKARRLSIERRIDKYALLLAYWTHKVRLLSLENAQDRGKDRVTIALRSREVLKAGDRLKEAENVFANSRKNRRAIRAKMRKKRTCCHCGKTAPLSEISFAYCGGCRDSGVARKHWMRYCGEACQRAHWHAGHKDVCPLLCSFSFAPGDK